jgi:hypothetical protein
MADNNARIDIEIGTAKAQSGGTALAGIIGQIKHNFLDLSAKIFVAERSIERVWALAGKGAQFEETMGRLNRQMAQFNSNAHMMVGELNSIARGQLSIANAASLASRALAVGLDPDQIRTFTKAADVLDDVMGTDLPTAFDNLVQAAITGRSQILANIGVYVDLDEEVRKLAVSTNRTTDAITKQEKVMLATKAITEQAGDAINKLSDGALSDADRLKQVEAKWENLLTTIGQGTKVAVVTALEWFEKLRAGIEKSIETEMKGRREMQRMTPGNINNPVTQEILGRAIVQNSVGNLERDRLAFAGGASNRTPTIAPLSIRGAELGGDFGRQDKILQARLERTRASIQAEAQLYDASAAMEMRSAEEMVAAKARFRTDELLAVRSTLREQQANEERHHKALTELGFETIQAKLAEEQRHKDKVVELGQSILTNDKAIQAARAQATVDGTVARLKAEEQLGARLVAQFKSEYDIQENLRRQAMADAEVYYKGEHDMAVARFASDAELAKQERELLREQLAFKLRLTKEEVDRILFLRKTPGHVGDAFDLAEAGDPTLGRRAVEGLVESASARDTQLAERANDDLIAGWRRGLQRYSQDRDSVFGMSVDMARRTAQAMEQGFQTIFFDAMEGRFQSFKDVLTSVLDFTKKILAQIAAQLVTVGLTNAIVSGFGNLGGLLGGGARGGAGGTGVANFGSTNFFGHKASGGSFTVGQPRGSDTVPVSFWGTPGEKVTVTPVGQSGSGTAVSVPIDIQVINQVQGAKVETQRKTGPDGLQQIKIIIRQEMKAAFADGSMTNSLQPFGVNPQPVGR